MLDEKKIYEEVKKKYRNLLILKDFGYCEPFSFCPVPDINSNSIGKTKGYSLSCGNPVENADLKEGQTVLDLGCGTGFDCIAAAKKVGSSGHVIGVDFLPEMLVKAEEEKKKANIANIEFHLGTIEKLPLRSESVDCILSNCVINLSPNKEKAFKEAFRVLKKGKYIVFSDILSKIPLPTNIQKDPTLYCMCIANILTSNKYKELLEEAGFENIDIQILDTKSFLINMQEVLLLQATIKAYKL